MTQSDEIIGKLLCDTRPWLRSMFDRVSAEQVRASFRMMREMPDIDQMAVAPFEDALLHEGAGDGSETSDEHGG